MIWRDGNQSSDPDWPFCLHNWPQQPSCLSPMSVNGGRCPRLHGCFDWQSMQAAVPGLLTSRRNYEWASKQSTELGIAWWASSHGTQTQHKNRPLFAEVLLRRSRISCVTRECTQADWFLINIGCNYVRNNFRNCPIAIIYNRNDNK